MAGRYLIGALLLVGCAGSVPPPRPDSMSGPAVALAPPPPSAAPAPVPAPAPSASGRQHWVAPTRDSLNVEPFATGPDYSIHPVPSQPIAQPLAGGAVGGQVSPDGSRVLVVPLRRGAYLTPGGSIPAGDVTRSRFSSSGRFLWLLDEQRQITVVSSSDARVVRTYPGADDPAFASGDRIAFRRGCQTYLDRLSGPSAPEPLGRPVCGEVLSLDADRKEAVVLDRGIVRFGTATGYTRVSRVDLETATWQPVFEYGIDLYYISVRISARGDRICAVRVDHHSFLLECRGRDQDEPHIVWLNSVKRIHDLDDPGDTVLFEGSASGSKDALFVADFRTRTVRRVGDSGYLFWRFFPGARRLIGCRSGQARIVDLPGGWEMKVGRPSEEWDGFGAMPGRTDRFLLGRERGGGRDLFWVTMPKEFK